MSIAMARTKTRFLRRPSIEIFRDRGRNDCLFVRLQRGKAVGSVRPDPEVLVFFMLDARGLPTSIDFLERRDPLLVLRDVLDAVARAHGADEAVRRRFRDPSYVGSLLDALRRGVRRLPVVPGFVADTLARQRADARARRRRRAG
jgi:hypothetical protein